MAPVVSLLHLILLMNVHRLRAFLCCGFGVPVPRGRSAALGEVSRRGTVCGHNRLVVVLRH
eukprot:scaffold1_cov375-Pavlova_lutheri.AAC.18